MPDQNLLQQRMPQAGFEGEAQGCLQGGVRPKEGEGEGGEEGEEGGREDQAGQKVCRVNGQDQRHGQGFQEGHIGGSGAVCQCKNVKKK